MTPSSPVRRAVLNGPDGMLGPVIPSRDPRLIFILWHG